MNSLRQELIDSGLANEQDYKETSPELRDILAEIDELAVKLSSGPSPTLRQKLQIDSLMVIALSTVTINEKLVVLTMIRDIMKKATSSMVDVDK